MAQFDVHRFANGLVVDCQSDLLDQIDSRFVVPLVPRSGAPKVAQRLNPVFEIGGGSYVMLTQAAGAVRRRQLGAVVGSLGARAFEITGALDVLVSGV
ncbi:MAG: CcdB family protein [Sphingomicrobium sp.]